MTTQRLCVDILQTVIMFYWYRLSLGFPGDMLPWQRFSFLATGCVVEGSVKQAAEVLPCINNIVDMYKQI